MAVAVCKICGEVSPFSWIGGFHCSQIRVQIGMVPLRMESWPPAQSLLIANEIGSAQSMGDAGLSMDSPEAVAAVQHISAC